MSYSNSTLAPEVGSPDIVSTPIVPLSRGRWIVAILATSIIAWLGFSFPPKVWRVPDELANVGALSPKADQDKLAVVNNENMWMNTTLKFGLAGSAFGLIGFFLLGDARNGIGAAVTSLICGVIAGLAAGAIGLFSRRYLDLDHPIPMISEQARPLFCDMVVFAMLSVILLIPISIQLLFQASSSERGKAYSLPAAGILTGILVPVSGAMVLPGHTNTSQFPPAPAGLTAIWFAALAVLTLILVVFMGSRTRSNPYKAN